MREGSGGGGGGKSKKKKNPKSFESGEQNSSSSSHSDGKLVNDNDRKEKDTGSDSHDNPQLFAIETMAKNNLRKGSHHDTSNRHGRITSKNGISYFIGSSEVNSSDSKSESESDDDIAHKNPFSALI